MFLVKGIKMNSRLAVIACFSSLVLLNGCSRTSPPAEVEYDHSKSPYHTVKKGDSIASIAQRYGMDKKEVVRLNGLKPPYKIFVGQKLLVTTAASAKAAKEADSFGAPADEGTTEMRGDVEVTTLQPMQGTEPHDQANAPHAGESTYDSGDAEASDASNNTEAANEGDEKSSNQHPKMPASAGAYLWPVKGKIIKGFEAKADGNKGVNISAPQATKVAAANNGVVAYTGNTVPGMGNVVLIKHPNGYMTVYAHLSEIQVKKNQVVQAGQKIGTVGKSGNVKEPQLHFEIRNGKTPIDPTQYLN